MKDHAERFARVARGWDEAAEGYDAYFVPRFAPWVEAAVEAVTTSEPPEGPVLVPCCGTFPELDGPFALMKDVLGRHMPPGDGSWEERLTAALTAAGAAVERDERVPYPMSHVDAPTVFDAYVRSGPLRALATARGEVFVDRLREEFLSRAPAGEWQHRPHARLIVAHRR
ncbi:hypothetical protein [Nonomuraea dietziae]|uniref:hypothetical protein n=1 Tax=Nonomuraea dietziae TaxID=65515 RepID=UPI0033C8C8FB